MTVATGLAQAPSGRSAEGLMHAFVMSGLEQVGFIQKPIPRPGPLDAIIRTTRALICTSDAHTVHGAIGPRENLILGHEAVGIVQEIGSEVRHFKPGDRVVVAAITPDWGDPASQAGHSSQSGQPLGGWKFSNTKDGVFAEYFHVNDADANLAHIPASVPDEAAVYCADMIPAGLMATAGARLRGAGLIIAVEAVAKRQELARHFGADVVVDYSTEDVVARIVELTGGQGVDAAIEAIGADEVFQNAVRATKAGGTISNIGYHGQGDYVHIPRLEWGVGMAEKTIRTGLCPVGRLRLQLLLTLLQSGRLDPTPLTSHTCAFAELGRAFEIMDKKLDGVVKPLITFD